MIYEFDAGILLCGKIRDFLEDRKFKGSNIEWRESGGWFEHHFVLKGDGDDLLPVVRAIVAWGHKVNEA